MEEMDEVYGISFQIIVDAGDARVKALQAIKKANDAKFEEAEELLEEARESLKKAHASQTSLIYRETNGEKFDLNIILIHSQQHYTMAVTAIDMAEQAIFMNRKFEKNLEAFSQNEQKNSRLS
jgi:PTS system cellobiose-specific IIA component